MSTVQTDNKKTKECESLIIKFIRLKRIFLKITPGQSDSILEGKIPDLKEIHRRLYEE